MNALDTEDSGADTLDKTGGLLREPTKTLGVVVKRDTCATWDPVDAGVHFTHGPHLHPGFIENMQCLFRRINARMYFDKHHEISRD